VGAKLLNFRCWRRERFGMSVFVLALMGFMLLIVILSVSDELEAVVCARPQPASETLASTRDLRLRYGNDVSLRQSPIRNV
jgi:hypothetical protein